MFLLFTGDHYYPLGGWSDFTGVYPSVELAKEAAARITCDWWHVVDVSTMGQVAFGHKDYRG